MSRVKMTEEEARDFKSGKNPLKKKSVAKFEEERRTTPHGTIKVHKRQKEKETPPPVVGGGALRGVARESMARVYAEIWPGMQTHRDGEVVDEIAEEAYILSLTMVAGNDKDTPRRALKIKEASISNAARFCEEHS